MISLPGYGMGRRGTVGASIAAWGFGRFIIFQAGYLIFGWVTRRMEIES